VGSPICNNADCERTDGLAWLFVQFVTSRDGAGMVAPFCPDHAKEARTMGRVYAVTCSYLPKIGAAVSNVRGEEVRHG